MTSRVLMILACLVGAACAVEAPTEVDVDNRELVVCAPEEGFGGCGGHRCVIEDGEYNYKCVDPNAPCTPASEYSADCVGPADDPVMISCDIPLGKTCTPSDPEEPCPGGCPDGRCEFCWGSWECVPWSWNC